MAIPVQQIAQQLLQAEREKVPLPLLTQTYPELTAQDAYTVQLAVIAAKTAQGDRIVGKKIGLTSPVMQNLFGVREPDYGHLLRSMVLDSGGALRCATLVQPKVEAEIAFFLGRDLAGPQVTSEAVLAATDYVCPALEIIDSRFHNWRITLADTIADNASSGRAIVNRAAARSVVELDLAAVAMTLECNGGEVTQGLGTAVLGHPAAAVAWLANKLAALGTELRAGELILSGSIGGAIDAHAGDFFALS
jgi:2-keto-4-pentenoate hydratase